MYVHIRLLKRRLNRLERMVATPLDYCCPACPKVCLLRCMSNTDHYTDCDEKGFPCIVVQVTWFHVAW